MVEAQANDAGLLEAYARSGSQDAFAQLVHRHIDMVHGTARRMLRDEHLAEDATQAVFLLLSRRAGHLRHPSVAGWLYLATTYTVRNMQRAQRRQQQREQAVAAGTGCRPPAANSDVDIDAALARLRPSERDALVLRYMQNLSVPEVATGLGISEAATGKRLVRAMSSLRRMLKVDESGVAAVMTIFGPAPQGLTESVIRAVAHGNVSASTSGLVAATSRGLVMLHLAASAKAAACILAPLALGAAVFAALPESSPALSRSRSPSTHSAQADAASSGDAAAIDPAMSLWWIDPASRYRIENAELIVYSPTADGPAFHAWIGGPSWENYAVSLELMIEEDLTPVQPGHGAATWNVQICPRSSDVFLQAMATACNICCMMPIGGTRQFTHISDRRLDGVTVGKWHRLEVTCQERRVSMALDGRAANEAQMPISTRGFLGLMVNFGSDAVVHIRNVRVRLLNPDAQQLAESQRSAKDNWMHEVEQLKRADKLLPKAPWPDER